MDIKFEKVSEREYCNKVIPFNGCPNSIDRDHLPLPKRATTGSAGYDFVTPVDILLKPNESIVVPTCIKAKMPRDVVLQIYPRSGLGFKYGVGFANTVGIIDSDYYNNPDNEGHIMIKLALGAQYDKEVFIPAGERFCQGLFIPFLITTDDEVSAKRIGGLGSTGEI